MDHYFCTEFAEKHGVPAALMFYHIAYWVNRNEEEKVNCRDGCYWMYSSVNDFHTKTHLYLTSYQIRSALRRLEEEGLILVGKYNRMASDRTKWYTLSPEGKEAYLETQRLLSKNQKKHLSRTTNANIENSKPLPI